MAKRVVGSNSKKKIMTSNNPPTFPLTEKKTKKVTLTKKGK